MSQPRIFPSIFVHTPNTMNKTSTPICPTRKTAQYTLPDDQWERLGKKSGLFV